MCESALGRADSSTDASDISFRYDAEAYHDEQWLRYFIEEQDKTVEEIADHCGMDRNSILYHVRKHDIDGGCRCPECDKILLTEEGMKRHASRQHDLNLRGEAKDCERCGDEFRAEEASGMKYCSEECYRKAESEKNAKNRVTKQCEECGDEYSVKPHREDTSRFCSRPCQTRVVVAGWNKKEHPELECERCGETYTVPPHQAEYSRYCSRECQHGPRATIECDECGEEFDVAPHAEEKATYCSWSCKNEALKGRYVGEKSPRWSGGDVGYYGPNWFPQRRKARIRDQSRCQICGATPLDTGEELTVHHIEKMRFYKNTYDAPKWWELGNRLSNLMCVCRGCHQIAERMSPLRPY